MRKGRVGERGGRKGVRKGRVGERGESYHHMYVPSLLQCRSMVEREW